MPSPPYIYNDLRASPALVRNILPNVPGALIRPLGDRRPYVIAHAAEARPGGRQAQPRKFAGPSAHRRVSSSLLAPAGPPGAPASPICHAFAGSPGQDRWFPWGPGVFHLSRFRWPPWSRLGPRRFPFVTLPLAPFGPALSLVPLGPRRFPFVAVALMIS